MARLAVVLTGFWSLAFYTTSTLREGTLRPLGQPRFSTASILAAQVDPNPHERFNALKVKASIMAPDLLTELVFLLSELDCQTELS